MTDSLDPINRGIEKAFEYLDLIIKPPVKEVGGILEDEIKVWRYKRQVRLVERLKEWHKKKGITPRSIPLKTVAHILEGSSLEEDDSLHDMWVALLANATDSSNDLDYHNLFVKILQDLSSEEAKVLNTLWAENLNKSISIVIISEYKIDQILFPKANEKHHREINLKSKLILDNFLRLRLFYERTDQKRWPHPKTFDLSDLGQRFMRECYNDMV